MQIVCASRLRRYPFIATREAREVKPAVQPVARSGDRPQQESGDCFVGCILCASPRRGASYMPIEKRREKRSIKMADFGNLRETAMGRGGWGLGAGERRLSGKAEARAESRGDHFGPQWEGC